MACAKMYRVCVCVMLVSELVFRRLSGCCTVRSCVVTGILVVEAVSPFIDAEAAFWLCLAFDARFCI